MRADIRKPDRQTQLSVEIIPVPGLGGSALDGTYNQAINSVNTGFHMFQLVCNTTLVLYGSES